ncbi:hypothetical protein HPB48_022612 [Haemaphysalis longicornis]|uniref:Uncharacterized protein n=1 Tax=Haemaphysalis longicornis TaxID=44386 RepID=A0A9J6GTJ0_HAELO|nr:hypothetical protein HPB48_022612 [Haemaphysalis longicornis]
MRLGNSACKDTSLDVLITTETVKAMWSHTEDTLGSHHFILATTILGNIYGGTLGTAKLTDWPEFCKQREQVGLDAEANQSLRLKEWTTKIPLALQTIFALPRWSTA